MKRLLNLFLARPLLVLLSLVCWCLPARAQRSGMAYGAKHTTKHGWVTFTFYKIEDGVLHIYATQDEATANGIVLRENGEIDMLRKFNFSHDDVMEIPCFGEKWGDVTPPWKAYADEIKVIWIHSGSYIGDYAFADMDGVEQFVAGTVTGIGSHVFSNFGTEDMVLYMPNLQVVGNRGMANCNARIIDLPRCNDIGEDGISYCPNLELIRLGGAPFIHAGGLAYNPRLVRAEGNNRPSVYLTNEKPADYRNDYYEHWFWKALREIWPGAAKKLKEWLGKGIEVVDTWIGVPVLATANEVTGASDSLFVWLGEEMDMDEKPKSCSPFGNVSNGEINVCVPPQLLSKYIKFYSSDMDGEKATSGYMTYNHKKDAKGGEKRPLGKLFAGKWYGPFMYTKGDVIYYDCAIREDGRFVNPYWTGNITGWRQSGVDKPSLGYSESLSKAWGDSDGLEELMLLNCKGIDARAFQESDKLKRVALQSWYEGVAVENIFGSGSDETYAMQLTHEPIGERAFYRSSITELRGTPSIIGKDAFFECTKLKSVNLSSCDSVYENAFYGCEAMTTVKATGNLDYIGRLAFDGCKALSDSLYINVETVPEYAFYGAPLSGLSLGSKCTAVEQRSFAGGKFKYLVADGLKSIGQEAFAGAPIQNLQLKSVELIGISAFEGSFQREADDESAFTLMLGADLKAISTKAFANAKGLEDPNESNAEASNKSLITLKGDVPLRVAADAFENVTARYVTLNVPTDKFSNYENSSAFQNYRLKTDLKAYPLLWDVGAGYAELSVDGTLTLTASEDYDSKAEQPWAGVAGLIRKIVVAEDVTTIGAHAFEGLSHLTSVEMEDTKVRSIGQEAFSNCPELRTVSFPKTLNTIGIGAFYGDKSLRNLALTPRLTTIGQQAFEGCSHIDGLLSLSAVETIGPGAFRATNLEELAFGEELKSIGEHAFADCPDLTKVTILATEPPALDLSAFQNSNQAKTKLICPDDAFMQYLMDESWSKFWMTNAEHGDVLARDYLRTDSWGKHSLPYALYSDGTLLFSGQAPSNYDLYAEAAETALREQWGSRIRCVQFMGDSYVPHYLFQGLTVLEEVKLSKEIKTLPAGTFKGCTALQTINLEDVEGLADGYDVNGGGVFEGCTSLARVNLLNLRTLGLNAFKGCTALKDAYFGLDSLYVGNSAFEGCTALERIDLGKTDRFGSNVFKGCTNLRELNVDCRNFFEGMFADCKRLHKVTFGKHIWRSLSMSEDPEDPFLNTNLDTIRISTPTPPILDDWCFTTVKRKRVVCLVPEDFIAAYREADVWKDFDLQVDSAYLGNMFPIGESLSPTGDMWRIDRYGIFTIEPRNDEHQILFTYGSDYNYSRSYVRKMVVGERTRTIGCFALLLLLPPDFSNLTELTLDEDLETIDIGTFNTFKSLRRVNCYAEEPPALGTIVRVGGETTDYTGYKAYVFPDHLDYANTELHVLADPGVADAYRAAEVWQDFKIIADLKAEDFDREDELLAGVKTDIPELSAPWTATPALPVGYYSLDGRRLSGLGRGITIVRRADGTAVKVAK